MKKYSTFSHFIKLASLSMAAALFITACDSEKSESGAGDEETLQFPREKTLYVGGFQWGPPSSFNPLHGSPAWPITGNMNLIYEALFGFNQLDGDLEGILATDYALDKYTLTVNLNPEAKWQDGTPLSSEDVQYTFNLHKKYLTNFHSHWNYIQEVAAVSPTQIKFTLRKDNYNPLLMKDIISTTPIIPKSVFEPLEAEVKDLPQGEALSKLREFKNDKPMGSGPYTVETYSDQKIVIKRVDSYWGKVMYEGQLPSPEYIIHSGYKSNDKFNLALKQGHLDLSQTFYPQIWNSFNKGVGTWYSESPYYIPSIIPCLLMRLDKEPLNDPSFRQALAHGINYEQIKNLAMYGYTPDLQPGLILPQGMESKYFSKEDADKFGKMYDPEKSKKILADAGYKWGADGLLLDKNGNKIPQMFATCPSGWSDWESTLKIVVSSLREIGLDIREKFVEYPIWDKDLKNGLFDFTMRTPQPDASPSSPWSRFEKVMSSNDWRPVGEVMYKNEGRYKNPKADSLLAVIPKLSSEEEKQAEAYRAINRLFMEEVPVLPLMYRPWHLYQFSTKHWTNFPTEQNPYAPPQAAMVGAGVKALWGIKPAK